MADPKNVSWRLALLGLLLGGLVAAGALALTSAADDEASGAAPAPPTHEDAMPEDERCAHMPEHCADGGA